MAAGKEETNRHADHGEWVLLEGEEHPIREGSHAHGEAVPRWRGPGLVSIVLIIVLLAIIAAATVTAPILTQRPWVGPWNGHEEILQGLMAGREMKVRVTLRNAGASPALNLRVAFRLLIGDPPPAPSPALSECGQTAVALPQSMLFPDATYSKTVATEQQIDDDTIAAVLHKDKAVYLAGCAQYQDSLMQWMHLSPRETHFCRIFVPSSAGNFGILGSFEDCPAGNSAD
jgi:hypothetical protein